MYFFRYTHPIGTLTIAETGGEIVYLGFGETVPRKIPSTETEPILKETPILTQANLELKKYFTHTLRHFTVPICLIGTDFQKEAWKALAAIPYGTLATYGEIAKTLGRPKAARAVGGACNHNPIAIIIPCHRVVGATGELTGFAGGLDIKEKLIDLEKYIEN